MLTTAEIHAPIEDCNALRALPEQDTELILQSVLEVWPPRAHGMEITSVLFRIDVSSEAHDSDAKREAVEEIEAIKKTMIAVATGGPRIDDVNSAYGQRRVRVQALLERFGADDPNPYLDLWDWYGKWSSGDLPTYRSRREYISDLFAPLLNFLNQTTMVGEGTSVPESTGWVKVDRILGEIRSDLQHASTEEKFQSIGLLCREALISLAQSVFDVDLHPTLDGKTAGKTDAKRMMDAYIAVELRGSHNDATRKHAKSAFDLANTLQHKQTADFRTAAMCVEATSSAVNLIAIVSGRRDP